MKFIQVTVDIPDVVPEDAKDGLGVRLEVNGPVNLNPNTKLLLIGTALDTALEAFVASLPRKCTCGKCPDYVPEGDEKPETEKSKDEYPPVTFGKMPKGFM